MSDPLLSINNLSVSVHDFGKKKKIVDDVSMTIDPLTIKALVGASGSGKTTIGLSILRLLGSGLRIDGGKIVFSGEDLLILPEEKMQKLRGKQIGMVFQEPLNAFNPVFTIGHQINEVIRQHTGYDKQKRNKKVIEVLDLVGLPNPRRISENYPHQLSGGMRQRAMIAQAIAVEPRLIIADEPTSNLDVTLQANIMELFRRLKNQLSISILLISHDLSMVAHLSDEVAVITSGKIVESGKTFDIVNNPIHQYTQELIGAFK